MRRGLVARRLVGLAAVCFIVVATASLFFVAGRFTSPQQQAADASPPPVVAATSTVQMRRLDTSVLGRGSVVLPSPVAVALPSVEGTSIITSNPLRVGRRVLGGDLLMEISNAPVVAFEAPFSPFRDLTIGDDGRDVRVLKEALRKVGYEMDPVRRLTARDMSTVARFYRRLGYVLPTAQDTAPAQTAQASGPSTAPTAGFASTPAAVPRLPRGWWVGIQHLPATVARPGPAVGQAASNEKQPVQMSSGAPLLRVSIPAGGRAPTVGDLVSLRPGGQPARSWSIVSARSTPAPDSNTAVFLLGVRPAFRDADVGLVGAVRVGDPSTAAVPAVPVTAVTAGADGRPAVRVVDGAAERVVPVTAGDQASGWVQVTPRGSRLQVGDVVRVGD